MLKWENKYFIKSIAIKKEQPIAISCLSICLVVLEDYKNAIKLLTDSIKGWEKPKDKIILLVVKAKLLHWYQMEKKGFKAHYERFKMESSIGNGVSMDDLDDGLSSDEEAYDSDDEVDVEQNQSIQIGRSLTFKKIKTKSKFENRNSIVSDSDISIYISSKSNLLGAIKYIVLHLNSPFWNSII